MFTYWQAHREHYIPASQKISKRRVSEHKNHRTPGFTDKHNIDKLLYIETFRNIDLAKKREKQIKGWKREKKIKLIDQENAQWADLSADWFD